MFDGITDERYHYKNEYEKRKWDHNAAILSEKRFRLWWWFWDGPWLSWPCAESYKKEKANETNGSNTSAIHR